MSACQQVEPACRRKDAPVTVTSSGVDTPHSHSRRTPQQPSATPIKCRLLSTSLSLPPQLCSAPVTAVQPHPRGGESCPVASGGKAMGGATSPSPWRRHCALHFLLLLFWSVRTSCQLLCFYFMHFGWIFFSVWLQRRLRLVREHAAATFAPAIQLIDSLELCYLESFFFFFLTNRRVFFLAILYLITSKTVVRLSYF